LDGERINGSNNTERTVSVTANGSRQAHVSWAAVRADSSDQRCGKGDQDGVGEGALVKIYASDACTPALIRKAKGKPKAANAGAPSGSLKAASQLNSKTVVHCTGQSTWCVRRETGANICYLQLTTASPLGSDYLGPFSAKGDAANAMCSNYDPTLSDPSKCWVTMPADTCAGASGSIKERPGAGAANAVVPPKPIPDQDTASENEMLAETLPLNGSMTCAAYDLAHTVRVVGFNNDSVNRSCEARCYYRTSQQKNGMLLCSVVVPSHASGVLLCEKKDQTMTYKVTNPGSYACH